MIEERQSAVTENAELLSLHNYRGEQWDGTWLYSIVAGRRAWEKFANVEAVQFYERALEASGFGATVTPMDLAEVWEGLGDARMRLGEYESAGDGVPRRLRTRSRPGRWRRHGSCRRMRSPFTGSRSTTRHSSASRKRWSYSKRTERPRRRGSGRVS